MKRARSPNVAGFYDRRTSSVQYVVSDDHTGNCAIIDPVLDFDAKSGSFRTENADLLLRYVRDHGLKVCWLLDTHPHADHCSAVQYLKSQTGAPTGIGSKVLEVQRLWKDIYNLPNLAEDGSQWDRLFADGDTFNIGTLSCRSMHSPGHTLASITFVVGDCAFVHDTLFMPDSGTARTDFPGGSATSLWRSIASILELPDDTRLFTGHDYQPFGRAVAWESSVAAQKRSNTHLQAHPTEEEFVIFRAARDASLPLPHLMLCALQINIAGGRLPDTEMNGRRYLKLPIGAFDTVPWT